MVGALGNVQPLRCGDNALRSRPRATRFRYIGAGSRGIVACPLSIGRLARRYTGLLRIIRAEHEAQSQYCGSELKIRNACREAELPVIRGALIERLRGRGLTFEHLSTPSGGAPKRDQSLGHAKGPSA